MQNNCSFKPFEKTTTPSDNFDHDRWYSTSEGRAVHCLPRSRWSLMSDAEKNGQIVAPAIAMIEVAGTPEAKAICDFIRMKLNHA